MTLPFVKGDVLTEGKAKTMWTTNDPDFLVMEFRDDVSAFDGVKTAQLTDKGYVNNQINAYLMQELQAAGIDTCFHSTLSENESLVYNLQMLPIECVVRNVTAGSLCRRLGVEAGQFLDLPIFEFFLKDDERHDPFINDSHILTFGWANEDEIELMRTQTLAVNNVLRDLFEAAGLYLVDFKLEWGWFDSAVDASSGLTLMLGDEFTPDGCRLWEVGTLESFDKDRFRNDEGDVVEFYAQVASRLGVTL